MLSKLTFCHHTVYIINHQLHFDMTSGETPCPIHGPLKGLFINFKYINNLNTYCSLDTEEPNPCQENTELWNRRSVLKSWVISQASCWNASL